jgi:hypothetical protein
MKCAAAARSVLRATAFLLKQGCSECSRSHLSPDTTEGETLREDVLFLARSPLRSKSRPALAWLLKNTMRDEDSRVVASSKNDRRTGVGSPVHRRSIQKSE